MAVLFWIRLDQICPKRIKLDQIGFLTNQPIHSFDWIRSYQIKSDQIRKSDQVGSNWIKKDKDWSGWLFRSNQIQLAQIGQHWFKLVQNGSNWITLDQLGSNQFKLDQIRSTWIKLVRIGFNCFKLVQKDSKWIKWD
jgi:hypothetical protein